MTDSGGVDLLIRLRAVAQGSLMFLAKIATAYASHNFASLKLAASRLRYTPDTSATILY
jgi:hypothetical protein